MQKCERRFNSKYRLYGQNKQIEDFDFLIWSGVPADLARLMFPLYPILNEQIYHQAFTSVVEMKNVIKESHTQFFAQSLSNKFLDNGVTIDIDAFGLTNVSPLEGLNIVNFCVYRILNLTLKVF